MHLTDSLLQVEDLIISTVGGFLKNRLVKTQFVDFLGLEKSFLSLTTEYKFRLITKQRRGIGALSAHPGQIREEQEGAAEPVCQVV